MALMAIFSPVGVKTMAAHLLFMAQLSRFIWSVKSWFVVAIDIKSETLSIETLMYEDCEPFLL